ncbi:MAG: hypothetical protein RIT81_03505 [Deltaproteobacteria bacterium]
MIHRLACLLLLSGAACDLSIAGSEPVEVIYPPCGESPCDFSGLRVDSPFLFDSAAAATPPLATAVGGVHTLLVPFASGSTLTAHVAGDDVLEIVDTGIDYVVIRGLAPGRATLTVSDGTRTGEHRLDVKPVARIEVGLIEPGARFGSSFALSAFTSRLVAPGGPTPIQVRLFDADGERLVDEGVTSASSTVALAPDETLLWDAVHAAAPYGAEGPQLVVLRTSDGRLWPARIDAAPEVDAITVESDSSIHTLRSVGEDRSVATLCFAARWRDRVVAAPGWAFAPAGGWNYAIEQIAYLGHITCVTVSGASTGDRRIRVTAGEHTREHDFTFR